MALTKFSERNLMILENFILHVTHCSEGDFNADEAQSFTPNELYQMAKDYIDEDHVDGEESEQAQLEREQSNKKICIYYWRPSRADIELLGYDPQQEFPYSEAKVNEIILDVINKEFNVQTRNNGEFLTICIDKGTFKQM